MGSDIYYLLDWPPPPGSLEKLPDEPLVPTPVDTSGYLDDIYTVGESSSERWRKFINCLKWEPRNYHHDLLKRRAYHARVCWEATFLLSFTDSSWLSVGTYRLMQDMGNFELRKVEIELLTFQLTAGMVGFKIDDVRKIYDCSVIFYTTMIWFVEKCLEAGKTLSKKKQKEDRKASAGFVHMKPFLHHGGKELAKNLDMMIHSIHTFLMNLNESPGNDKLPFGEIGKKLKMCIQFVDPVILIID